VLLLLVGLAFTVYVAPAAGRSLPGWVTLFELTGVFWLGLAAASVAGSLVLLLWGYLGRTAPARARHRRRAALPDVAAP
jgi:hypothetical protein